jgi:polar amino acid transport system permease protein
MNSPIFGQLGRFFSYYNIEFILEAAFTTLLLSLSGCVFGFILGFGIALLREPRGKMWLPLRAALTALVEVFRRIPFLVTLFLVFYACQALNLDISVFAVAVISTCIIGAAFLSEIIRGGFESISHSERQAAQAMNFTLAQTLFLIVIPQAWRVILPPTFAFFLSFIKDSALASQLGVVELTYAAKVMNNKGFSPVLGFGSALALYFVISYPLARLGQYMERRLALSRHRRP